MPESIFPKQIELVQLRNRLMENGLHKTEWKQYVALLSLKRTWRAKSKEK